MMFLDLQYCEQNIKEKLFWVISVLSVDVKMTYLFVNITFTTAVFRRHVEPTLSYRGRHVTEICIHNKPW